MNHAYHEAITFFIVQLAFVLTVLDLQLQPGVPVTIQLLSNCFHNLIFSGDPCLASFNVLYYPVIIIQLLVSLLENFSISFNFLKCFPFHLSSNTFYVVSTILLTSPDEGIEISPCPSRESLFQ
uniref:Uncharacterized protein n=1 Tax=Opuntia streptacantha TaxID=393608 RepID=A0A7C9AAV3_OPUST